ncbi:hypothetical protein ACA910_022419 [Epithemia clementina (nom. ined.)]
MKEDYHALSTTEGDGEVPVAVAVKSDGRRSQRCALAAVFAVMAGLALVVSGCVHYRQRRDGDESFMPSFLRAGYQNKHPCHHKGNQDGVQHSWHHDGEGNWRDGDLEPWVDRQNERPDMPHKDPMMEHPFPLPHSPMGPHPHSPMGPHPHSPMGPHPHSPMGPHPHPFTDPMGPPPPIDPMGAYHPHPQHPMDPIGPPPPPHKPERWHPHDDPEGPPPPPPGAEWWPAGELEGAEDMEDLGDQDDDEEYPSDSEDWSSDSEDSSDSVDWSSDSEDSASNSVDWSSDSENSASFSEDYSATSTQDEEGLYGDEETIVDSDGSLDEIEQSLLSGAAADVGVNMMHEETIQKEIDFAGDEEGLKTFARVENP